MIFFGDLVFSGRYSDDIINIKDAQFIKEQKLVNFESLILDEKTNIKKITTGVALYSSKDIFKFCRKLNIVAGTLSNNHITDYELSIDKQKELYQLNNIYTFGAGDNLKSSQEYYRYHENGDEFIVLTFGWEVIGCKSAKKEKKGTNPLTWNNVLKQFYKIKNEKPDIKIIIIFHWNYEFELYPQPAIREMSHFLIDQGAYAIIGHHSHIVQGYEIYKNRPIFFGLGNFYFRNEEFKQLRHWNDSTKLGLGIKLSDNSDNIQLFWVKRDKNKLSLKKKESLRDSDTLKNLSIPFNHDTIAYNNFFKVNRKVKKLTPVYYNFSNSIEVHIKNYYCKVRQSLVNIFKKIF